MDTGYLSQQVTTIINQLHGYFDEIGVPSHERDTRESELFSALSETLHNQLKLVATEKHELTEEAQRLIKTIRQMEASLDDSTAQDGYDTEDSDIKVTYPLLNCLQTLKEKHHTISKLHRERLEQVKKLVEALQSYASHLEPSFVRIALPPTSPNASVPPTFDLSPTYVAALDAEFSRVYEEYNKRIGAVKALAEEIVSLWSELGTPQAQIDSTIVECSREGPEQLGLHTDDLARLKSKKNKLVDEKKGRERRLKELKTMIEGLWDRLGIEEPDRKAFLAGNRGCGLRSINEFEDELARLNELKKQNLHLFVEDARFKLQELWDGLYFSEEEMLEFTPAFSDVYSDALLSAHEAEIARLTALKDQRAPTLALIERHRSLIKDRDDLAASSQDASRLMLRGQKGEKRDPTRLLREEKMRKRIAKELPKVEDELRKGLEAWEDEYGRPFLVRGEQYLEELGPHSGKAAQARSKTPSGPPLAASTKSAKSTANSAQRGGTVRGIPAPRSKTPTSVASRNPLSSSIMAPSSTTSSIMGASVSAYSSIRSPSKIPARVPLSNMPHGNNSPERRIRPPTTHYQYQDNREDFSKTIRGGMGPPRAPPPKMKDLFVPPTPPPPIIRDAECERSASIVRHTEPEDVYHDRAYLSESIRPGSVLRHHPSNGSFASYQSHSSSHHAPAQMHLRPGSRFDYPAAPAPPSRQISNTSVATTSSVPASNISGSENWETYTDSEETEQDEEPDARDAYYAKVRAAQTRGKRLSPFEGYAADGKRMRGHGGGGGAIRGVLPEESNRGVAVGGSEAGWSDDGDAF
ncbi:Microtubule bundling protein [Elasticomyces elasticus]|nr:Microtubule bundling protein [Elasticomyces elasticus]